MQFALPTWSWQGGTPKHHRSLHKSLTSRLPPFCCEKLLRDQPSWSLVCIPLPITTQKLQKSPKCDWPHTIQNVVHKGLITLKRAIKCSWDRQEKEKIPREAALAHPAAWKSSMMDGFHWQQWTAMRDRFLFPGSYTLSFDLPHWPVCWCTWQGCPGPLQVKAQHSYSCQGPAACCYPPPLHFHTVWPDGDRAGSGILDSGGQGFQSANSFQD